MSLPPLASIFRDLHSHEEGPQATHSPLTALSPSQLLEQLRSIGNIFAQRLQHTEPQNLNLPLLENLAADSHQLFLLSMELLDRTTTAVSFPPFVYLG